MSGSDTDRIARLERVVEEQQRVIDALLATRAPAPAGPVAAARSEHGVDGVSRRDVLRRALVAGGAVVAGSAALAVADAAPAAAATGDAIKAGTQTNTETSTVLYADAAASSYPYGVATVLDTPFDQFTNQGFTVGALNGISTHGSAIGVGAYGASTGLNAASDGGTAVFADGTIGIQTTGTTSYALHATTGGGSSSTAVYVQAHTYGTAIEAHAEANGRALQAFGGSEFYGTAAFLGPIYVARSGVVRIKGTSSKARRSATVTGVPLTSASHVIATIQGDGGAVGVAGVALDVKHHAFVVNLTASVRRYVSVAWIVIN